MHKLYRDSSLTLAIAAFVFFVYLIIAQQTVMYTSSWKKVQGSILKIEEKHSGFKNACEKRPTYEYNIGNVKYIGNKIDNLGTDFEGFTSCSTVASINEGDEIELSIDPKNPKNTLLAGSSEKSILFSQAVALLFSVVFLFVYFRRKNSKITRTI